MVWWIVRTVSASVIVQAQKCARRFTCALVSSMTCGLFCSKVLNHGKPSKFLPSSVWSRPVTSARTCSFSRDSHSGAGAL